MYIPSIKQNKKIYILLILVVAIILIIFFIYFVTNHYKNKNNGNNISNKTLDECEEYIYNIGSYEAIAEITVNSNKNTNKYIVKQKCTENEYVQEVLEPENIKGVRIVYKDNSLNVENTTLDLKKIYEDYPYMPENMMFLTDFIFQYKESKLKGTANIRKENNNIIYTINLGDKYKQVEQLYVNEETGKPEKMIVQDDNQKEIVYILYNEIKLNNF